MSITTYAELVSAIQNYTADSTAATAAQIDDAIRLGEIRIYHGSGVPGDPLFSRGLRSNAMERRISLIAPNYQTGGTSTGSANAQSVTGVTIPSDGSALAFTFVAGFANTGPMTVTPAGGVTANLVRGANYDALEAGDVQFGGLYAVYYDGTNYLLMPGDGCVPLPSRFMGGRMMYYAGTTRKIPFINDDDAQVLATSINGAYTIEESAIRFIGIPAATQVDFRFYRRPQNLISALNDVFRGSPNLWLYAALLELAIFIQNDTYAQKYYGLFMSAMQGHMQTDAAVRSGTEQTFQQAYPAIV